MATKLRTWQLPYESVLYLDADALLLAPTDALFQRARHLPSGFAAERGLSPTWFNAGVMLVHPSQAVFDALLESAKRAAARGSNKRLNPRALLTPLGC